MNHLWMLALLAKQTCRNVLSWPACMEWWLPVRSCRPLLVIIILEGVGKTSFCLGVVRSSMRIMVHWTSSHNTEFDSWQKLVLLPCLCASTIVHMLSKYFLQLWLCHSSRHHNQDQGGSNGELLSQWNLQVPLPGKTWENSKHTHRGLHFISHCSVWILIIFSPKTTMKLSVCVFQIFRVLVSFSSLFYSNSVIV